MKACWYAILENDLSPDCKFFATIKDEWESLDTGSEVPITTLPPDIPGREEALDFLRKLLDSKNKRDEVMDYSELGECAMVLLGEKRPRGNFTWKKPGACHKARFMAYGIYS